MSSWSGLHRWNRVGLAAAAGLPALIAGFAAGCAGKPAGPATANPPPAAAQQTPPHPVPERDEPKKPIDYKKPPLIDNSRCYVCHLNLEEDPFVRWHAWTGAGCEKCHGESDAHCGDENHATAPDILYAKGKIADACWVCHPEVKPPKGFKPPVAEDAKKVCTDCHGKHRLENRQRKWDKATGKLIVE